MFALAFRRKGWRRALEAGALAVLCAALPLRIFAQPNPATYSQSMVAQPPSKYVPKDQVPPGTLAMPDVGGLNLQAAQLLLRQKLHRLATSVSAAPSLRPRGMVAAQFPAANTLVAPSTPIRLVLSSGPPYAPQPQPAPTTSEKPPTKTPSKPEAPKPDLVVVPPLVGLTSSEARDRLGLERLYLGRPTEQPSPNPGGRILSSSPPAGARVRPGSSVDYAETSGRNLVPPVVGLSQAQAAARLRAAGFGYAIAPVKPGRKRLDEVATQSPAAGAMGYLGDDVALSLRLASPPPPDQPPAQAATPVPSKPKPQKPEPQKPEPTPKPDVKAPTDTSGQSTTVVPRPASRDTDATKHSPSRDAAAAKATGGPERRQSRLTPLQITGAIAALLAVLATTAVLALRAVVHVVGVLQGGVEHSGGSDGAAAANGPDVLLNWDLQLEPAHADEDQAPPSATAIPETTP